MTKRLIAAVLALTTAFSVSACGNKEDSSSNASNDSSKAETTTTTAETTTAAAEESKADESSQESSDADDTSSSETDDSAEDIDFTEGGTLKYWSEDSEVAKSLVEWVEEVTDPESDKFIPVEDRIVASDLDGTLIGELYPTYFDHCIFVHRALYDDTYDAPEDMKEFAKEIEKSLKETGKLPSGIETKHAHYAAQAYKGMTIDELKDYAKEFMKTKADGFENLTRGDAYYRPMKTLIDYLNANDFTFYIVSGTDRTLVRALSEEMFDVPDNHIIGTDTIMVAENQGKEDGLDYTYSEDDEVVFGGEFITKNLKMNKVTAIAQEIGITPVLCLGNSGGDLAMAEYTVKNEKYDGRAYLLLCDDVEREHGKPDVAESFKETCEDMGFYTVSMKDDFATIYGDDVTIKDYEDKVGQTN